MRIVSLMFLISLSVISCQEKKIENKAPQSLIKLDEFSAIMADLYLAEAFGINDRANSFKESKDMVYPYYKEVLDKYKVNMVQFDSSYRYYQKEPEIMLEILDKARLMLEELKKTTLEEKTDSVSQ